MVVQLIRNQQVMGSNPITSSKKKTDFSEICLFCLFSLNIKSIIPYKKLENGSVITDKDYAALALGQFNYGVTLRETTAAYSIFSTQGIYNEYRSYFKVTDYKGNVL